MARTVAIGQQDFETIRNNNYFYIDKTDFIREWWENGDSVTLIMRPRRFGKTLNMSMVEQFFSVKYANREDLFEGLSIWEKEKYRDLQGTYPVISLSFANVKEKDYPTTRRKICQILTDLYAQYDFLLSSGFLNEKERAFFKSVSADMGDVEASFSLHHLANYLSRYYGKKTIILLDEYDTPMQEAYVEGYWEELVSFTRSLFNAAFKTNPYLERAIMTGITRVSKESIFSDLNNLTVITTTTDMYTDSFGFREEEVFAALEEYGLADKKMEVKEWYDGFIFGTVRDIYNPWSIINYLREKRLTTYWANTSSNRLIGMVIREGSPDVKADFEELMRGGVLEKRIDEQIVFQQFSEGEDAVWSLLLAGGYLRVESCTFDEWTGEMIYQVTLTNMEVRIMFRNMIRGWFTKGQTAYNSFVKALLKNDLQSMNVYMNRVALTTFSYFDSGKKPSEYAEPERFYHGFVLGLVVELSGRYVITSNRESGFGRYDVMMEPLSSDDDAMILEFKVYDPEEERTLEDTVQSALLQIEREEYASVLTAKGISKTRIRTYGFAFKGKTVLIGGKQNI
ncbi:MAG: AAA family ATPase [Lachnospiraceae bacterium]|nr:AAA family ATPase [Lachnospiraceae bacterium]